MIRALVLTLIALTAAPAAASADTTATAAQLTAAAHVPVVRDVAVLYEPCPDHPEYAGCTWPGATVVYVDPPYGETDDFTAYHELGHQFAFRVLGPGGLRKFARMTRHAHHQTPGPRSWLEVGEQFADAYATCALDYVPHPDVWAADGTDSAGNFPTGYGYQPKPRTQRAVCAMVDRAGRRAGLSQ